jgi:hypothetical protein
MRPIEVRGYTTTDNVHSSVELIIIVYYDNVSAQMRVLHTDLGRLLVCIN